jgi:hypothetical protein
MKRKIITPYNAMRKGMKYKTWKKLVPIKYGDIFNKSYWTMMKKVLKLEGEI